jgi:hypothetical protein
MSKIHKQENKKLKTVTKSARTRTSKTGVMGSTNTQSERTQKQYKKQSGEHIRGGGGTFKWLEANVNGQSRRVLEGWLVLARAAQNDERVRQISEALQQSDLHSGISVGVADKRVLLAPENTDVKNLGGPYQQVAIDNLSRLKNGLYQVGSGQPSNDSQQRGVLFKYTISAREGAIEVGNVWVANVLPKRLLAEKTEYAFLSVHVAGGKGDVLVRAQKWKDDQITEEMQDWYLNDQIAAPKFGLGGKIVIGPGKGRKCMLSLWVRPPLKRAAELNLKHPGCVKIAQRLFGFRKVKNATVACKGDIMTVFVMPETLHAVSMYTAEQWRERMVKTDSEQKIEDEETEDENEDEERKEMDDGITEVILSPEEQHTEYSEKEGMLLIFTTFDGKHKRVEVYPPSTDEYVLVATTEQGDLLEASMVSIRYYNRIQ